MPQLKLNYFDFHGGRAEPVRLALHLGGVAFEDHRFTFPEFAAFRTTTPFGQVPTLHVDGLQVTQSDAILRYAGKLAGLYPTDPLQALLCDEVAYVVEEASVRIGPTFRMSGEEQKAARLALVNGSMPVYLAWLQASAGGAWRRVFCRQPPDRGRPEGVCGRARPQLGPP